MEEGWKWVKVHYHLQGKAGMGQGAKGGSDSRERKKGKATLQLIFVLGEAHGAGLGSSFPFPAGSSFPRRWQPRGLTSIPSPGSLLHNNLRHQGERLQSVAGRALLPPPASLSQSPSAPCANRLQLPGFPREESPAISHSYTGGCAWDLPLLW